MTTVSLIRNYIASSAIKVHDDVFYLSDECSYVFDESSYDARMNVNSDSIHINALIAHKKAFYANFKLPSPVVMLEIGCGTGLNTIALSQAIPHDLFIVSDKSSAFVNLTKLKFQNYLENSDSNYSFNDKVLWSVLSVDSSKFLLNDSVSAVFMSGVLHHIADWKKCLENIFIILKPGGILSIIEPCFELALLLSAIFRVIIDTSYLRDFFSDDEVSKLRAFSRSIIFRLDSSQNKESIEEKHTFRIDDMLGVAYENKMECMFFPHGRERGKLFPHGSFESVVVNILSRSGGFSHELITKIFNIAGGYINDLSAPFEAGRGPYQFVHYVFRKPV